MKWLRKLGLIIVLLVLITPVVITTTIDTPYNRASKPTCPPCCSFYHADREQLEAAVSEFMQRSGDPPYNYEYGDVPIVNESVVRVNVSTTNCRYEIYPDEDYYVIAVCPLLTRATPRGILREVPRTAHPMNCRPEGANVEVNVTDCNCTGSYVWLTTKDGDIASICMGEDCREHGEDSFQYTLP